MCPSLEDELFDVDVLIGRATRMGNFDAVGRLNEQRARVKAQIEARG